MNTVRGFYKNSAVQLWNALTHSSKRQRDLAAFLGVTSQQINNLLTGKAKIPAKHLKPISVFCDYDYETLLDAVVSDERARIDRVAKLSCSK